MEVHRMGPQREELRQEEERVQLRREELRREELQREKLQRVCQQALTAWGQLQPSALVVPVGVAEEEEALGRSQALMVVVAEELVALARLARIYALPKAYQILSWQSALPSAACHVGPEPASSVAPCVALAMVQLR